MLIYTVIYCHLDSVNPLCPSPFTKNTPPSPGTSGGASIMTGSIIICWAELWLCLLFCQQRHGHNGHVALTHETHTRGYGYWEIPTDNIQTLVFKNTSAVLHSVQFYWRLIPDWPWSAVSKVAFATKKSVQICRSNRCWLSQLWWYECYNYKIRRAPHYRAMPRVFAVSFHCVSCTQLWTS